jgi:hypothetical protein
MSIQPTRTETEHTVLINPILVGNHGGFFFLFQISMDANMQSKGFAFVHFENEESALKAIEEVNGFFLESKKV